ncbi:hypothetical protein CPB85DRAFT_1314504 [Mucidula mucida]|nr:hypothetical protein CPB85DRAFT_1314504 [Mucidula mucida]
MDNDIDNTSITVSPELNGVPVEEHLASASTSLAANNAALSNAALQVNLNVDTTSMLIRKRHSLHLIDEATKAHMQSVEAICTALTQGIATSDPSQSFLNLSTKYLPDLHLTRFKMVREVSARARDVEAAADEAERIAGQVQKLSEQARNLTKESQGITVLVRALMQQKQRLLEDQVGLLKERIADVDRSREAPCPLSDGLDELMKESERLTVEAETLMAKAMETANAAEDASHVAANVARTAVNGASELKTAMSVLQNVDAFIKELEMMWTHMRPRMPLDEFNM